MRDQEIDMDAEVEIICRQHGSFWVTPRAHLAGEGCPICEAAAAAFFADDHDARLWEPIVQVRAHDYLKRKGWAVGGGH